ncbi:hypothetical protein F0U60_04010 [Archangium minus]|uniref:Uncharacterized protein n=1 Tax=Archangium minus TaxID=83450 RepID=A0ABY9WHT4_9BACT|nr:hypothetical protein F0U60_04010 [Archangium minus]
MSLDTSTLFTALHQARQRPGISAEDVAALVSAAHAIHFIELGGHEYNFEDYLTVFNAPAAPPIRSFATLDEASTWLKEHPITPRVATPLLIARARYCVAYSLESGLPTPLRIPTAEELKKLDSPMSLALHEARKHLGAVPEHEEALISIEVALQFIQESGLSNDFAGYLAEASNVPIPPIRSFTSLEEADTWLKNHPRPPHGGWVRIGQDRYSVGYWRESGRRVLLRVPTQEELNKADELEDKDWSTP